MENIITTENVYLAKTSTSFVQRNLSFYACIFSEIVSLKSDLQMKSEQEVKVSSQVSSEVSSICYEEQIEKLESEKRDLLQQIYNLNVDKEKLLTDLEMVKKEKQEISAKLDFYIQV